MRRDWRRPPPLRAWPRFGHAQAGPAVIARRIWEGRMASIVTDNAGQYGDSRKLAARARLHSQYSVAETDWFFWVAGQLPLRTGDHVLDIGCGPGWFWAAAVDQLPQALALTLADLSPGMVDEALRRCEPLPFEALRVRGPTRRRCLSRMTRSMPSSRCICSTTCPIRARPSPRCIVF